MLDIILMFLGNYKEEISFLKLDSHYALNAQAYEYQRDKEIAFG